MKTKTKNLRLLNNLYSIDTTGQSDEGLICSIRLIGDSPVYKAHFPMQPITPGTCIVQMAVEIYESFRGKSIDIVKVKNVKFLNAMIPDSGKVFRYAIEEKISDQGMIQLRVTVTSGDVIYAKLSLICKEN